MTNLMTAKQLADFLNMPLSSIYSLTHQRGIPFIKINQRLRFRPSEIEDWLKLKSCNGNGSYNDS